MPFTEAHRTALKEVAAGIAGYDRIDADIHLDDRLRFAAVEGVDGTYVEVLTGAPGTHPH